MCDFFKIESGVGHGGRWRALGSICENGRGKRSLGSVAGAGRLCRPLMAVLRPVIGVGRRGRSLVAVLGIVNWGRPLRGRSVGRVGRRWRSLASVAGVGRWGLVVDGGPWGPGNMDLVIFPFGFRFRPGNMDLVFFLWVSLSAE